MTVGRNRGFGGCGGKLRGFLKWAAMTMSMARAKDPSVWVTWESPARLASSAGMVTIA